VVVYSYAESASHLLYQIYCELVLPIPPVLEHLRSPDSNENERSVPLPSVTDVMLYQSSSADFGQSQTDRDRPRYVILCFCAFSIEHTHTHTCFTALFPRLPGWAGPRKVKPIWILLKQETVSGSGISWAICKYAPCSRQITMPATHHSVFYRPDALPATQPTVSNSNNNSSWLS